MRRAAAWLTAGLLGLSACDATTGDLDEQIRQRRLTSVGVERFDSAGAYDLAGVSAYRTIEIEALEARRIGADTLGRAFDVYRARCGSCHDVPDPGERPAWRWEATLGRMRKNVADAGLMPMSREDEALVMGFLREHAGPR